MTVAEPQERADRAKQLEVDIVVFNCVRFRCIELYYPVDQQALRLVIESMRERVEASLKEYDP